MQRFTVSATTVQLLQAAADVLGGPRALALQLGIGESLLARFMNGSRELPDALLLRAVDIILADRQFRSPNCDRLNGLESRHAILSPGTEVPDNVVRGNSAAFDGGSGG